MIYVADARYEIESAIVGVARESRQREKLTKLGIPEWRPASDGLIEVESETSLDERLSFLEHRLRLLDSRIVQHVRLDQYRAHNNGH